MKKTKISRFEVDFKTRLEQQRTAKNTELGYVPYRVYEIKETKGVSKGTLNGVYGSIGTGKSSYAMTVARPRHTSKSQWQQVIINYMSLLDRLEPRQYEIRWLKEKQATVLRLKGHTVESTTADDESSIGPVKTGL